MNNVSTKDWIEWLIMGFSFLFSLYVYVNHTRRLNRQQKTINDQQSQINDYIIKENEEQERNKKKACIICEILDPIEKGKARRLRMKNMGLSDARNINIEIIDNEEVFFFVEDDFFPYAKLLPTQHVDISYRNDSYKEQYNVRFTCSDDFCEENSSVQVIVFP